MRDERDNAGYLRPDDDLRRAHPGIHVSHAKAHRSPASGMNAPPCKLRQAVPATSTTNTPRTVVINRATSASATPGGDIGVPPRLNPLPHDSWQPPSPPVGPAPPGPTHCWPPPTHPHNPSHECPRGPWLSAYRRTNFDNCSAHYRTALQRHFGYAKATSISRIDLQ